MGQGYGGPPMGGGGPFQGGPPGGGPPGYGPPGYGGGPPAPAYGGAPSGYGGGPPPGGFGPPGGPPGGFGAGPGQGGGGLGRFTKYMIIGAVLSGVVSAIPLLNILNCCFCMINVGGIVLAISMYLRANPNDRMSTGEAAGFGGIAGAGAGVITAIFSMLFNLALGEMMAEWSRSVSPQLAAQMARQTTMGIAAIPVDAVIYGAFGAIGGVIAMQLLFKSRLKS